VSYKKFGDVIICRCYLINLIVDCAFLKNCLKSISARQNIISRFVWISRAPQPITMSTPRPTSRCQSIRLLSKITHADPLLTALQIMKSSLRGSGNNLRVIGQKGGRHKAILRVSIRRQDRVSRVKQSPSCGNSLQMRRNSYL